MVLADGQSWYLPRPWLEVHAVFDAGAAVGESPRLTYGPELDALIEAIGDCEDNAALLCGAASLGSYLIRVHYELTDQDLDNLFAFRVGDPSSWGWVKTVMDVATGQSGPKRGRGGAS